MTTVPLPIRIGAALLIYLGLCEVEDGINDLEYGTHGDPYTNTDNYLKRLLGEDAYYTILQGGTIALGGYTSIKSVYEMASLKCAGSNLDIKPSVVDDMVPDEAIDNLVVGTANNMVENGSGTRFKYEHNPSENPKVLTDAVEDPNAVYGYRPREDGSLASFANGKWDDPIAVEGYRQDRIAYHNRNEGAAQQIVSNMTAEGASPEDIARAVNEYRNQSRINSYIDADGKIKNIDGYNAALARAEKNSYENLIQRGNTPEDIIKSATKGNPAMDACTGLYDEFFDTY